MKINQTFECEKCGKSYNTEKEALACEHKHEYEAKLENTKKDISAKISDMVNMYIDKFGEMPDIEFTKKNREVITRTTLNSVLDMVADLFVD